MADDEDTSSVEEINGDEDAAMEAADKLRKRAGLPEIHVDALPSSVTTKVLSLNYDMCECWQCQHVRWLTSGLLLFLFPRTCIGKRQKGLQELLDRLPEARDPKDLNQMILWMYYLF